MKSIRVIGFVIGCVVLLGWAATLWNLRHIPLVYIISGFNICASIAWLFGVCTASHKNKNQFMCLSLTWICLNLALLVLFCFKLLIPYKLPQEYVAVVTGIYALVLVISCSIYNYLNKDFDHLPPVSQMRSQYQPRLVVKRHMQKRNKRNIDGGHSGGDDWGGNNYGNDIFDRSDQRGDDFFVVLIPDDQEAYRNSHGNHRSSHATHYQHNYDPHWAPSHHAMHHTGMNSPSYHYHSNDTHCIPSHSTHHSTHTSSHDTHTSSHDTHTSTTTSMDTATTTDVGTSGGGDTGGTISCD